MSSETKTEDSTDSLQSIFHGSGLFFAGKGISHGIGFITNIILTRLLGSSLYGIYSYFRILSELGMVFSLLGSDKSILKYVPEYEEQPKTRQAMITIAYVSTLVASVALAVVIYYIAPIIAEFTISDPIFVDVLRVGAFLIPAKAMSRLTFSFFRGINRMDLNVSTSSVLQPAFQLVFVGGAVVAGYSLIGATAGLVVAGLLVLIVSLYLLHSTVDTSIQVPSVVETKQYYNFSVPLTFNHLGSFMYNRIDILMVGFFLSGSAVGIYNIAVIVAGLLSLVLMAFNQMFPPIASQLYHNGQTEELKDVYSTVTWWTFTLSLFPACAALLYSPEILTVFGEDFARGQYVLSLFIIAQLTNCAVGPSGFFLMMSNHQYLTMFNQLSSGILNGILNVVLIINFGFIGAALATASVLAGINILRVIEVWYLEGFFPYDRSYLKPIIAAVGSMAVMFAVSLVLNLYLLLVIGGISGGLVFVSSLYALGISQSDIEMLKGLVS